MKAIKWCDWADSLAYKDLPEKYREEALEYIVKYINDNDYFICADTHLKFAIPIINIKDTEYRLVVSLSDWSEMFGYSNLLLSRFTKKPEKLPKETTEYVRRFNATYEN